MNGHENWTVSFLSRASEIKSWTAIGNADLRARFRRHNVKVNISQYGSFRCLTCTNVWSNDMVCFDEFFCTRTKGQ